MALLDSLRVGLLSGIPVAVVTALLFMARYRTSPILRAMKFPWSQAKTWAALWGFAFVAAIILGVIGAWVYGFVSVNWGWGPAEYFILGAGLATLLSVLALLPFYEGKRMKGALDISALNFIVGVGFGVLVPYVAA